MVGSEDIGQIVADKYKPILRFMIVVFGVMAYFGYWIIRGYNVYADVLKENADLQKAVQKLEAQDTVTRKQIGRIILNNSRSLKVMFERHDINGDMAQDGMSSKRKAHYRERIKYQRREEVEVLLEAGRVAQN